MLVSLKRIIKSGWVDFKRNSGLSVATIFIMVLTISIASSLFMLQKSTKFLEDTLREKVDMFVYFQDELTTDDVLQIKDELSRLPEIKKIEYISKEESLAKFTQKHKDDKIIMDSLEEVGGNPLLASLNIEAWQASQYAAISSFLDNSSFKTMIVKVDYAQKKPAIERLLSLTRTVNRIGLIASLILSLVALMIIFNTVRLAIYNSKEEVETMKLVGASNWFIQGPFLVQGAIAGFFATIITIFIFAGIILFLNPKVALLMPGLSISGYFFGNLFFIILIQMATGVGLGIISSWLAVRRYLKG